MSLQAFFGDLETPEPAPAADALPVIEASSLPAARNRYVWQYDDGEKFAGGMGATNYLVPDYWALRNRSVDLFERNLYARGMIRRLITNEINTGLQLEASPDEMILGKARGSLAEWSEEVENRFSIWCSLPWLCDQKEAGTFGDQQRAARMESLIAGDVLCVLRQDRRTQLPRVHLIRASAVQSPLQTPTRGNEIRHGVEIDPNGRQVAYWVQQKDGTTRRLPAFGERSGRRLAWLIYGTNRRLDDVRGKPILSLVLQSLKEIDRYRDSVQRKAVINSMLAMFIKKDKEKMGTTPMTGGAIRRGTEQIIDGTGEARTFNVAEGIPGLVLDELQVGEEPHGFNSTGTDEKFGDFEDAIIQAVAWANEIPPEIMRLAFSNNYSASQAAINEFKMYLNRIRTEFGADFCTPIYNEWLLAETLKGKINADGLIAAWRDRFKQYDTFGAWTSSDWSGHIKPSTDILKQAKGYEMLVNHGWISNDRAARELTGTKYSKNVKKLLIENEAKAEAQALLAPPAPEAAAADVDGEELAEVIQDAGGANG